MAISRRIQTADKILKLDGITSAKRSMAFKWVAIVPKKKSHRKTDRKDRPLYYDSVLSRLVVENSCFALVPNLERLDYNPSPPIFACKFAESTAHNHYLALANEDGRVAIYDATKNTKTPVFREIQCHSNAIFDLAWMPNQMFLVTASGDHSAKLWDAGRNELRWIRNFQNHSRSVRVVVFRPKDCSVFATGGRDGRILIWDTRCNNNVLTITKPENSINNGHPIIAPRTPGSSKRYYKPADGTNSVTALVFQDDNTLISCGSGDGNIRVWDLRRNYSCCKKDPLPKHSIPYYGSSSKNGYSNLILDESKLKLYANCMDHKIYCYNVGTYGVIPEQIYSGYNASFYIKSSLSPDGKYLISGSSDENAYIWNLKYSNPIIKLTGHSAEVTCAVWSHLEQTLIATCSDDNQHKIWTIGQESYNESERFGMTGRALEVELANRNNKPHWSMLEKTPKASKRKWVDSRDSSNKKSLRKSENDLWSDVRSQYKRKPKRNLFEMYSNSLAHINEETPGSSPKQLKFDSTSDPAPSTSTAYGNIYSDSETDLKTPDKFSCSKAILNSPSMYSSPTMNLPNFVSDGKAPHLRNFTPQKRKEVDWLTKLVRDKINGQSKIPKIENSEDSSKKVDQAKTDKTLLNFFNVIPATPNSPPLTDKTNDLDLGSKRKASESCEHVPVKRPNLGNESKSPTNKKLQERKSYKSLRTYFRSKTDFENKF